MSMQTSIQKLTAVTSLARLDALMWNSSRYLNKLNTEPKLDDDDYYSVVPWSSSVV